NGNGANYANFSFSVQDSAGAFDTVPNSVTINVTAVNDAPVDGDETNSVTEDVTLAVNAAAGLLANSTDVDGGTPTVTSFLVAGNAVPFAVTAGTPGVANLAGVGILTINSNGSYSFAPALNYTGAIPVVTYTVDDGNGGTDTSTLTLSMTPVNDAPVANPDSASTPINTALNNIDVKANDTDVDNTNAQLNVSAPTLANPAQGTVTLNPDGTLNFVPNTGITGPVIISYTLTDPDGLSSTGTLTVNVGANTPPDSADITRTINEDTPLTLSTSDFAFTDPDALQTLNAVRIDTLPANGTLTLNGTPVTAGQVIPVAAITAGNLVFSPALNGNGANYANFSFSVQDSAGAFDTVPNSVTITVTAVNDAPVAVADTAPTLVTESGVNPGNTA
ncbi:MAG: Ig-like domain-containing protein, partial [Hydrogenophaga sp.]|nr:Ig-like domain-containing protein [Hydrogenophaga sp.]